MKEELIDFKIEIMNKGRLTKLLVKNPADILQGMRLAALAVGEVKY